jgi:hypothetical protein
VTARPAEAVLQGALAKHPVQVPQQRHLQDFGCPMPSDPLLAVLARLPGRPGRLLQGVPRRRSVGCRSWAERPQQHPKQEAGPRRLPLPCLPMCGLHQVLVCWLQHPAAQREALLWRRREQLLLLLTLQPPPRAVQHAAAAWP